MHISLYHFHRLLLPFTYLYVYYVYEDRYKYVCIHYKYGLRAKFLASNVSSFQDMVMYFFKNVRRMGPFILGQFLTQVRNVNLFKQRVFQ